MSTVFLISNRHNEKLPEVTFTSRENPGLPAQLDRPLHVGRDCCTPAQGTLSSGFGRWDQPVKTLLGEKRKITEPEKT